MDLSLDFKSLTKEQKINFIKSWASEAMVSENKLMSLYLVIKEDIFFFFLLMSGEEFTNPDICKLQSIYNKISKKEPAGECPKIDSIKP